MFEPKSVVSVKHSKGVSRDLMTLIPASITEIFFSFKIENKFKFCSIKSHLMQHFAPRFAMSWVRPRQSSFNMTRGGGMKILRGGSENF